MLNGWKNDLFAREWTVPASRMKMKREHIVPLSDGALAVLQRAEIFKRNDTPLVFPSQVGKMLSDNTLSKIMRDAYIVATQREKLAKVGKDLLQAVAIINAVLPRHSEDLREAWENAWERSPAWRKALKAGAAMLDEGARRTLATAIEG